MRTMQTPHRLHADFVQTWRDHIWQVTLPNCHTESEHSLSTVQMNLLGLHRLGSDSLSPIFIHSD